jgi:hypothetical protein
MTLSICSARCAAKCPLERINTGVVVGKTLAEENKYLQIKLI